MTDSTLDPSAGILAAAATGYRQRRDPREHAEGHEAPITATPPPETPTTAGESPAPPLPEPPPEDAFIVSLLASGLDAHPTPADRRPEGWTPPASSLHLTDREA